jgi:hypothetical protein
MTISGVIRDMKDLQEYTRLNRSWGESNYERSGLRDNRKSVSWKSKTKNNRMIPFGIKSRCIHINSPWKRFSRYKGRVTNLMECFHNP